jgi:hypothetical protein
MGAIGHERRHTGGESEHDDTEDPHPLITRALP